MITTRPVLIIQLPEQLNLVQSRDFLTEVSPVLKADRPRLVFDFSQVQHIDSAGVDMLLQCLETVMRRDGDLKLAALSPQARVILELTRVDRLFEVFETTADAAESFDGFPIHGMAHGSGAWYSSSVPGNGHATDDRVAS